MMFPLLPHQSKEKSLKYERVSQPPAKKMRGNLPEKPKPLTDALVEDICSLCKIVGRIDCERALLNQEVDKLKFGLQRFAGSDNDIRFYTGFPNYNTFISFYKFLLPAATQLNYWGSDCARNEDGICMNSSVQSSITLMLG